MKRLGFYAALLPVVCYCLAPMVWQLVTSLRPAQELTSLPPLLPTRLTAEHYAAVFAGHQFGRIIVNSLVVAAGSTLIALAFGSAAAFALAKLRVKGQAMILAIVLATSMFPPIATVSPLYIIINALALRDTLIALIIVHASFALPLAVWVLTNFMRQVPDDLYAAARVDGASALQTFWHVMMPLAVPGLVATGLLVFILSWNEFLYALTFTATTQSRTIPVGIALFPGLHQIPWGEIAAASLVVTLPIVAMVLSFQRRIVEGLTAGAVKG